jgi:hypothetical protein
MALSSRSEWIPRILHLGFHDVRVSASPAMRVPLGFLSLPRKRELHGNEMTEEVPA